MESNCSNARESCARVVSFIPESVSKSKSSEAVSYQASLSLSQNGSLLWVLSDYLQQRDLCQKSKYNSNDSITLLFVDIYKVWKLFGKSSGKVSVQSTKFPEVYVRSKTMVPTPLNIDRHQGSHDSVRGWSWSHKTSMHSIEKVPGGKNKQLLYSTANDPQPQMIPRSQMIPKTDRKWSSTASDP